VERVKEQRHRSHADVGPEDMKRKVISHMRWMKRKPDLIRSFFHAPATQYAAQLCPRTYELISNMCYFLVAVTMGSTFAARQNIWSVWSGSFASATAEVARLASQ
jgi:hypothetical protein